MSVHTCTTAANAPACPPPTAFLTAFWKIAFQSIGNVAVVAVANGRVVVVVVVEVAVAANAASTCVIVMNASRMDKISTSEGTRMTAERWRL